MPDVRAATPGNIPALLSLNAVVQDWHAATYSEIFKPAPPGAALAAFFADRLAAPDCRIWLSCTDGTARGYLFARLVDRPETIFAHPRRRMMIEHIAVATDGRRTGHGAALIAAARRAARTEVCDELALDTGVDNAAAHAFFRAMGLAPRRLWFVQPL